MLFHLQVLHDDHGLGFRQHRGEFPDDVEARVPNSHVEAGKGLPRLSSVRRALLLGAEVQPRKERPVELYETILADSDHLLYGNVVCLDPEVPRTEHLESPRRPEALRRPVAYQGDAVPHLARGIRYRLPGPRIDDAYDVGTGDVEFAVHPREVVFILEKIPEDVGAE